jgi:methyl-accepting chemotaxis protein
VLKNLKFSHKIFLMPALAAVGIIVIFIAVQMSAGHTEGLVEQIDGGYIPKLELSRDLVETLAQIQRGLQDAAAAADPGILAETDNLSASFAARLDGERDNPTIDSQEREDLEASFNDYYDLARDTTRRLIAQETGDALSAALERMRTDYLEIKQSLERFADSARTETNEAVAGVRSSQRRARNLVFFVLLAVACALGALSITLTRSIVRPLAEMVEVAGLVAGGDLSRRIGVEGKDEVGQTSKALNQAFSHMRATIKTIAENASSLNAASEQMTGVSQQMAASAEETSSQATVVSASAEQVSRNVETVATGIEEMTSSIREIAQSANEAAKVATTAVRVAETTTGTIAQLDESSSRISDVTKVITSISEQTNLLALNATIEAARAGEAGRGFAVVANEVKELAKETASATEEISKRVEAIQHDTGSAVAAINQIAMIIRQIHETQNTIASAVEEQTATTNEIGRSVSEVAKGSSDIASTISGVATATQDTAAGASSTQHAAHELATMANQLKQLVARFRYDDN